MTDITYAVHASWLTGNTFTSLSGGTYKGALAELKHLRKNPAIKWVEIIKCKTIYTTSKRWRRKGG